MKKNYPAFLFLMGMMLICGRAAAQSASVAKESNVLGLFIMEDVLFKGITAHSQAELLTKKIQRVEQEIADPAQRYADEATEASRKTALIQIKARLLSERSKPNTNSSNQ